MCTSRPPSCLLGCVSNIVLPSTTRFFKLSRSCFQTIILHTILFPYIWHMPRPSSASSFGHYLVSSPSHEANRQRNYAYLVIPHGRLGTGWTPDFSCVETETHASIMAVKLKDAWFWSVESVCVWYRPYGKIWKCIYVTAGV